MSKTETKKYTASVIVGEKLVAGEVEFKRDEFIGSSYRWAFKATLFANSLYGDVRLEGDGFTDFRACFLHMAKSGVSLDLPVGEKQLLPAACFRF